MVIFVLIIVSEMPLRAFAAGYLGTVSGIGLRWSES